MKGMITDVSLGGCCFEFSTEEQNKILDISKKMPVTLESWQLKAQDETAINAVVQSIADKYEHECIGLKFEEIPRETYTTLESFITNALQLRQ